MNESKTDVKKDGGSRRVQQIVIAEKPTEEEAKQKWDRLPQEIKDSFEKDFGMFAEPLWIYYATICGFTEKGKKL